MFNIGLGEILFIALLALIFIGPERLPKVLRQLGEVVHTLRQVIAEFTREFGPELGPLQEMRSLMDDLNPTRQIGRVLSQPPPPPAPLPTIAPPAASPLPGWSQNPIAQLSQALAASTATNPGDSDQSSAGPQTPDPTS